jgi:hypothetical protein
MLLVRTDEIGNSPGPGGRRPLDAKHSQKLVQRRADADETTGSRLPAATPGEVSLDEPIDRSPVDRPLAHPSTEVLNREDILMQRSGCVPSRVEELHIVLKDRSEWIPLDARPHAGATKDAL